MSAYVRCATLSVALTMLPAISCAAVTFTSATRYLEVTASNSGVPVSADATDTFTGLGIYSNSLSHQVPSFNSPPGLMQIGFASQMSNIGDDQVTMSGVVTGIDNAGSGGAGFGIGRSYLTAYFTVDQPVDWFFEGTVTVSGFGTAFATFIRLQNLTTNTFVVATSTVTGFRSGTLPSGSYQLSLHFSQGHYSSGTGGGTITYASRFVVPAPAAFPVLALAACFATRRRR